MAAQVPPQQKLKRCGVGVSCRTCVIASASAVAAMGKDKTAATAAAFKT
jgi:hypothetical protein